MNGLPIRMVLGLGFDGVVVVHAAVQTLASVCPVFVIFAACDQLSYLLHRNVQCGDVLFLRFY